MDMYFAPLACSLASRITAYEAGLPMRFVQVDMETKQTSEGDDFFALNAMGQVPTLRADDGTLLTENPVVLQFLADSKPESGLAPNGGMARYRLQQWLNFIATELHKAVFIPLLDPKATEDGKAYALSKAKRPLDRLQAHLDGREFLLDGFTVADAYLLAVLNWTRATTMNLAAWPAIATYYRTLLKRPAVAKAVAEEFALYKEEQARRQAA
jgi:glutathione S-transferase